MKKTILVCALVILTAGCAGSHVVMGKEALNSNGSLNTWTTFQRHINEKRTTFKVYKTDLGTARATALNGILAAGYPELKLDFNGLLVAVQPKDPKDNSVDPYKTKLFVYYRQVDATINSPTRIDCETDYYHDYKAQAEPVCPAFFNELDKTLTAA